MPRPRRTDAQQCLQCGNDFISRRPSRGQKFCGAPCRIAHFTANRSTAQVFVPHKPRKGDSVNCKTCGQEFYRMPTEIKRGREFCSVKCAREEQKRRVLKECEACGKEFEVTESLKHQRFCSHACEKSTRIARPLDRLHNGRPARVNNAGYIMLWEPEHPAAFHGWLPEHRYVAERTLGRSLTSEEVVHHVNGVKMDNRPENLEVLSHIEHMERHANERWGELEQLRTELARYKALYGPLP